MKINFLRLKYHLLLSSNMLLLLSSPTYTLALNAVDENTLGALTGGSITAGTANYSITSYTSTIGLENDLTISDGVTGDLMFESGWLYRVLGDTAESLFPEPDTESFTGNELQLVWLDVDSRGLMSADLTIEISQPVAQSAILTSTLFITNISGSTLSLDVFKYSDIDAGGSFGNDVANLVNAPDYIEIIDGGDFAEFRGGAADAYQVAPFAGVRNVLIDNLVTNLNNSGLPMPANDYTGAFQWTTEIIPPEGTFQLQTIAAFSTPAPAPLAAFVDLIFKDDFE